ncbi:hypothetical protein D3C71_2172710 [compost metagenome]
MISANRVAFWARNREATAAAKQVVSISRASVYLRSGRPFRKTACWLMARPADITAMEPMTVFVFIDGMSRRL